MEKERGQYSIYGLSWLDSLVHFLFNHVSVGFHSDINMPEKLK